MGASSDKEGIRVMQQTAVFDKPHIKKSAFVVAECLPQRFSESLKSFSRGEFPAFNSRDETLAWMAKD
jgi:hypothetical protein